MGALQSQITQRAIRKAASLTMAPPVLSFLAIMTLSRSSIAKLLEAARDPPTCSDVGLSGPRPSSQAPEAPSIVCNGAGVSWALVWSTTISAYQQRGRSQPVIRGRFPISGWLSVRSPSPEFGAMHGRGFRSSLGSIYFPVCVFIVVCCLGHDLLWCCHSPIFHVSRVCRIFS